MLVATVFLVYFQNLLLAGQAPVSGHLSPTPLLAALYQSHSRKRPAPVTKLTEHFYDR